MLRNCKFITTERHNWNVHIYFTLCHLIYFIVCDCTAYININMLILSYWLSTHFLIAKALISKMANRNIVSEFIRNNCTRATSAGPMCSHPLRRSAYQRIQRPRRSTYPLYLQLREDPQQHVTLLLGVCKSGRNEEREALIRNGDRVETPGSLI